MVGLHAHRTPGLLSATLSAAMVDGYWNSQTPAAASSLENYGAYGVREAVSSWPSPPRSAVGDDLEHQHHIKTSRPMTPAHDTEHCAICTWGSDSLQERATGMPSAATSKRGGAGAAHGLSAGGSTAPRTARGRAKRPGYYWPGDMREAAASPTRRRGRGASSLDRCLRCSGTECLKPGRDCCAVGEGIWGEPATRPEGAEGRRSYEDATW